jgi:xyloglucan galactosyltransferase MUR3
MSNDHSRFSGMGGPLDLDNGMMNTWHFSMFSSIFNRLRRSSRRTLNPEEASLFIIPYDLALDGNFRLNCKIVHRCTPGYVQELVKALTDQPYFARHDGADHVVLWSLGHYHPWPKADCDNFMGKFCARCAITCYWMDPIKIDNNFVSVPFPSSYHWWEGIKELPWDAKFADRRNTTVVYLGGTQTLNPDHTKIRRAMAAQCRSHAHCTWLQIGHTSTDTSLADLISSYRRSVFCLCPPGDDPGRKAMFDILLSGCIPVVFHVNSLMNQYPLHIGENTAREVSVSIPGRQVYKSKLDFMSYLLAITPETIRRKQRAIAELAPRLQYSLPPLELLENIEDETTWDPPFEDAVDVIMNGFADRAEKVIRNVSTGIPEVRLTYSQWSQRYGIPST